MTEPDQIEFPEHVEVARDGPDARSIPMRIGIVAGSALLLVVGAVAAMGASTASSTTDGPASPTAADFVHGGFGRAGHGVTISAINGSSLSLKTDDGWTRTITVGSSTTITRAGATIAVGDLAVGDQIGFRQQKAADGTYTITAIGVVLPAIGGQVTAISGNTITVTGRDGTTGTIHVDGDTTYDMDGTSGKALADLSVGGFVVAVGTLRADGSLDADAVHSGFGGPRGLLDGRGPGRGFGFHGFGSPDDDVNPDAAPSPAAPSSAS